MNIKRLLLPCIFSITCLGVANTQAEMRPFQYDTLLASMYLQVDMSPCPRIVFQEIGLKYNEWLDEISDEIQTKEDAMYIARLSYMYSEVFLSFHYGN